jgi:hypothetical protein
MAKKIYMPGEPLNFTPITDSHGSMEPRQIPTAYN